jgi:hypothetical protein
VFANAAKQYLSGAAAEGRAGGVSTSGVRNALQQRRQFYPGNAGLRGDASQQVLVVTAAHSDVTAPAPAHQQFRHRKGGCCGASACCHGASQRLSCMPCQLHYEALREAAV